MQTFFPLLEGLQSGACHLNGRRIVAADEEDALRLSQHGLRRRIEPRRHIDDDEARRRRELCEDGGNRVRVRPAVLPRKWRRKEDL